MTASSHRSVLLPAMPIRSVLQVNLCLGRFLYPLLCLLVRFGTIHYVVAISGPALEAAPQQFAEFHR